MTPPRTREMDHGYSEDQLPTRSRPVLIKTLLLLADSTQDIQDLRSTYTPLGWGKELGLNPPRKLAQLMVPRSNLARSRGMMLELPPVQVRETVVASPLEYRDDEALLHATFHACFIYVYLYRFYVPRLEY